MRSPGKNWHVQCVTCEVGHKFHYLFRCDHFKADRERFLGPEGMSRGNTHTIRINLWQYYVVFTNYVLLILLMLVCLNFLHVTAPCFCGYILSVTRTYLQCIYFLLFM